MEPAVKEVLNLRPLNQRKSCGNCEKLRMVAGQYGEPAVYRCELVNGPEWPLTPAGLDDAHLWACGRWQGPPLRGPKADRLRERTGQGRGVRRRK